MIPTVLGAENRENLGHGIPCDPHSPASLIVLPVSIGYPKGLHIHLSHSANSRMCPKEINVTQLMVPGAETAEMFSRAPFQLQVGQWQRLECHLS